MGRGGRTFFPAPCRVQLAGLSEQNDDGIYQILSAGAVVAGFDYVLIYDIPKPKEIERK